MANDHLGNDHGGITLASALFQASVFLESAHPAGSQERQIAAICWQAYEALEALESQGEAGSVRLRDPKNDRSSKSNQREKWVSRQGALPYPDSHAARHVLSCWSPEV